MVFPLRYSPLLYLSEPQSKVLRLALGLPPQEISGLFNLDLLKHHGIHQKARLPSLQSSPEVDGDDLPGKKLFPGQVYCRLSVFIGRL